MIATILKSNDMILPSIFLLSSGVCLYHPEYTSCIVFGMIGMGLLCIDSLLDAFVEPITSGVLRTTTKSLNSIVASSASTSSTTNEDLRDLSEALSNVINHICFSTTASTDDDGDENEDAVATAATTTVDETDKSTMTMTTSSSSSSRRRRNSSSLGMQVLIKSSLVNILTDRELHVIMLQTIQEGIIQASNDVNFRQTLLDVTKKSLVAAMKDEVFIKELMNSIVDAIILSSQNEKLRDGMLEVITKGMSDALQNEQFVKVFRSAVKDTLQDKELYRASAKGILSAAIPIKNPFGSSSSSIPSGGGGGKETSTGSS